MACGVVHVARLACKVVIVRSFLPMADKPETKSKLDELVKRLASNKIGQEELLEELTAVVSQVGALEIANHRFREDMRGQARAEWSRYLAAAIKGMCGVDMIALDFEDHQFVEMVRTCGFIAEEALMLWKLRWVDGVVPVRRRKRAETDEKPTVEEKPATPEQTKQFVAEIEANLGLKAPPEEDPSKLWGPDPDKKYGWQKPRDKPQMGSAESPKATDLPKLTEPPKPAPDPPPPRSEPVNPTMTLAAPKPEPPKPPPAAPKPEAV